VYTVDVSIRLAYATICIGKGLKTVQTFCAFMDLHPSPRFECHNRCCWMVLLM
jgi:hypothetical protein